ncbi:unnamed protein product [Mytilus coruscus]|uniref:Ig-like domain-containing protein n=1 Tax=Mytilus coruscus TaxID=42192 RepID=A0A6J8DSL6_MYTCO|nr:unnamed protein product [Mytilus coruscus]
MVKRVDSHFQDGIIDVHISAVGVNIKKGFTTREGDRYFKKVQKLSCKEHFNWIGSTNPWSYADNENEQQLSCKGDSNWLGNTCLFGLDSAEDEFIDELINSKLEKDNLLENLKRSEYDAEGNCYEQNKEQEINLPVRSTLFPHNLHKCNPSIICEDNQKDHVEKQKDGKESLDKSTNIKVSMLTKEWLKVWQTIPTQILNNLKGFCDQLKKTSSDLHEWSLNCLNSFSDLLGLTFLKGRNIPESLCQDEKSAEPPSTQGTKYKKNQEPSFNKTGWGTGILILMIFCAVSSNATATGLDVRPITKVALDERIELQCKKANDGGTKWVGGPKNEILTIGKTIKQQYTNYFSLIDTNETYNLVIKNATWEFVNSSYTCHVRFIQDSTKRLSEYGYEVIPKLESLTVMQSKKSDCLNETIEFKKVNPLPNCTTSLDKNVQVEVTYLHKQWYEYYYAVTVGLVVKNCDGCNGTIHCYVGNEVLNISFEQDMKAETSPLSKDEESHSQTYLIVGLGVGVTAAVVIVGVIIGLLYKGGICRGKTKRQGGRADKIAIQETPLMPLQNNQAGENEV